MALFRRASRETSTPTTTLATDLRLLAVDVETTGLNPKSDTLLSIGWVPVDGYAVRLGGAAQRVVRGTGSVGQSAVFHGITDDDLTGGVEPAEMLTAFAAALEGRVLLAHYAAIETGFLAELSARAGVSLPAYEVVDTMTLQRRVLSLRWDEEPRAGSLRLWAAREHFGLPPTRAHDALTDALACGELYLAQVAELQARQPNRPLTLKDLR